MTSALDAAARTFRPRLARGSSSYVCSARCCAAAGLASGDRGLNRERERCLNSLGDMICVPDRAEMCLRDIRLAGGLAMEVYSITLSRTTCLGLPWVGHTS